MRTAGGDFLRRAGLLWSALLGIAGVGLCFVPLFDVLGYEASLVLALLTSLAAVHLGTSAVCQARLEQSPADREAADARPLGAVAGCFGRALRSCLAALALPLLALSANGLRVRNCNYLSGLAFFLLMPVLSAACGAALGTGCGLLVRRRWQAVILGWVLVVASLGWALLRFLRAPAIYAYDPFFGYFPGALYDEEVAVPRSLLVARLLHGAWIAAGLLLCAVLLDGHGLHLRLWCRRGRGGLAVALLLCSAVVVAGQSQVSALGIHRDAAALERVLSAERRTPHFVLRYNPSGPVAREIDLYAREHELRYRQLRDLLGVEPRWQTPWLARLLGLESGRHAVVSYLFDSARQKQELMGAGGTYIAKPWRREIYLQHEGWPHSVLRHELAHVFLGAAGDPLLRLSLRRGIPHQGMIEGMAVAADWRGGGALAPHQMVKAMREAGLEPPLEQIFGLSFLTVPAGRAYAVAGSFCRYLLERFGPGPMLAVYRQGGAPEAFSRALGVPFARLAAEWRAFIDRQPVAPREREVERERVRRPAVFYKVCAHELALRRQQAREAQARGEVARAERLLRSICHDDPAEPRHWADLMEFYFAAGLREQAQAAARQLLGHPRCTPVLQGRALALLADLAWLRGAEQEARDGWRAALERPLDEAQQRLLIAKISALADRRAGPLLLRVLVGEPGGASVGERDGSLDLYFLQRAVEMAPEGGLSHYLLGRQLYHRGGHAEAAAVLGRSVALGLPDRRLVLQAHRLRAQALLRAGDPDGALAELQVLLRQLLPDEEAQRMEVLDWTDRARSWARLP
ncbi:MAG: hypothetical protein RMK29_21360 [Myxococcales bacterium]|nr:hypothetical protein [Myxococcota bacterium]MDW8284260.1 hypothetical protein [Myxococcales bacterium]